MIVQLQTLGSKPTSHNHFHMRCYLKSPEPLVRCYKNPPPPLTRRPRLRPFRHRRELINIYHSILWIDSDDSDWLTNLLHRSLDDSGVLCWRYHHGSCPFSRSLLHDKTQQIQALYKYKPSTQATNRSSMVWGKISQTKNHPLLHFTL